MNQSEPLSSVCRLTSGSGGGALTTWCKETETEPVAIKLCTADDLLWSQSDKRGGKPASLVVIKVLSSEDALSFPGKVLLNF